MVEQKGRQGREKKDVKENKKRKESKLKKKDALAKWETRQQDKRKREREALRED